METNEKVTLPLTLPLGDMEAGVSLERGYLVRITSLESRSIDLKVEIHYKYLLYCVRQTWKFNYYFPIRGDPSSKYCIDYNKIIILSNGSHTRHCSLVKLREFTFIMPSPTPSHIRVGEFLSL